LIQKARNQNIMNGKSEYNRCALPRLTAKLGEKDLEKWRKEDRMEAELEEGRHQQKDGEGTTIKEEKEGGARIRSRRRG
jgi:hypothetical protein